MMRRCFTQKITESDAFLEMPLSTQCLYFHLNMYADDDGFVNSPKKIARTIGANDDDIKLLIAKSFILAFESGVIVIKHWRMHNTLRNDRYHPTDYQEEYRQLGLKNNNAYTMVTKWQPNGNQLETEHNITKHNITKLGSRYVEAGYPDSLIERINEYLLMIKVKEMDNELYSKILNIYYNDEIIDKESYVYITLKKKGLLDET